MSERNHADSPRKGGQVPNALRVSEEHLPQLVAGVEDYAIFLLDPAGHIASWNAGAQRIKGYRADEIIGKHFSIFYLSDALAREWPAEELRLAEEAGRVADEGWRVRKDGSRFWASVVITALREADGTLGGFLKITRDLTERKRAEDALRHSEEHFRLLVEGVQDYAIFMLGPQGHVISWNVGAERIKGYRAGEILGRHFSCFYPPEAIAQGKPQWQLRTAVEQGRVEDEGWRVRKDGSRFWANAVLTALFDREGHLRGFAKVTRDMTDRRKIEALQEADRQKNEFLAMLSHELRNPLAPIRNALSVIGHPAAEPAAIASARHMADRQVEHMARLLDDLLDLARISHGTIELRRELLDIAAPVQRAVEVARPFSKDRGHDLTVAVPPQPLWVHADATRLEQVVSNLLHNAIKYTDAGGRIWVTAEEDGTEVVLRVRDSGIGIDPVMLPRIFDLFVQAERRLDRSVGGVGIGLTLVKRLVELHDGTVQAFSPGPGKGSEFVVRLPAADLTPGGGESRPQSRAGAAAPESLRVLVVDDNVDAADSLAMLLRLVGHEVRVAYNGPDALSIAPTFQPQVVMLDIGMPHMDGYEVARQLRVSPDTRQAMLVTMTGWGQHEDQRRAKEAGFDSHLTKPADLAALEKLLAQCRTTGLG